jgi:Domain of unknown function (DUF4258)
MVPRRRLIFSRHALREMRERKISKREVRMAVNNHDTSYPGTHKTRPTVVKTGTAPSGRRLRVVLDAEKERVVVTAYWAS